MFRLKKIFSRRKFKIIWGEEFHSKIIEKKDFRSLKKEISKILDKYFELNILLKKIEKLFFKITLFNPKNEIAVVRKVGNNYQIELFLRNLQIQSKELECSLENLIFDTLNHEMIHILHYIYNNTSIHILKKVYFSKIEKINDKYKIFKGERLFFEVFYTKLLIEGLAVFFQEQSKLDLESFNSKYIFFNQEFNLKYILEVLFSKEMSENEKRKKADEFTLYYYQLGCVMVYSIMIGIEEMKLEELFELDNIRFIELYEQSVEKINKKYNTDFKILFSYSSGKGVLDYTQIVKRLKELEKEERKSTV